MDMDNPTRNDAIMYVSDQEPFTDDVTLSAAMKAHMSELVTSGLAEVSDEGRQTLTYPAGTNALHEVSQEEKEAYIDWIMERGLLGGNAGMAVILSLVSDLGIEIITIGDEPPLPADGEDAEIDLSSILRG